MLVHIGNVGTGFSDRDLAALMHLFSALETSIPQLADAGLAYPVVWLEPVLVGEVAYQEVTRDRKLRIPRFIRIRPDKKPGECTTDQLADVAGAAGTGDHGGRVAGYHSTGNAVPAREYPAGGPLQKGSAPGPALKDYHERRNFSATQEPEGMKTMTGEGNIFVVQEHHARKLHYDLRLERDGVLKSWAVPRGLPEVPGVKHLAVAVEDHPLDYAHFEGTIPAGEYGAGTVTIWDTGTYETTHWDPAKIEVTLHGKRLTARYVLVAFRRAGKNEWLLFRAAQ
jgi:DNA ligase D-like protein (predicted 3'-phosphoesterase)